jgi:ABC-type microcin C transport system duplicated ATPase subunit YejF
MTSTAVKPESDALVRSEISLSIFPVENSDDVLQAVDRVSFDIRQAETLGWSVNPAAANRRSAGGLLRLHDRPAARSVFEGRNIVGLPNSQMQALRREMQIIFQDPYASLNPRLSILSHRV